MPIDSAEKADPQTAEVSKEKKADGRQNFTEQNAAIIPFAREQFVQSAIERSSSCAVRIRIRSFR
jgi:hypothetical protein